jgi:MATE family multidrug resistance protein
MNYSQVLPLRKRHKLGGMKELLILALPIIASQSCETIMVFTDRVFLSKLSSEQMNAATGGGISSFLLLTFFIGLIGFSTALTAQFFGAKKYEQCSITLVQSVFISIFAYPIIIFALPLLYWYFEVTHISAGQMMFQKQYVQILVFGSIISLIRHSLSCYFSGIGRTKIVMMAAIFTMVVNIGFNYVFIFGHLGMPAMGIRGAALGTILSALCGVAVMSYVFFSKKNVQKFQVYKSFKFHAKTFKTLLRYGTPAGTEFFVNFIAFSLLVFLFHSYNEQTATAASIMFNWDMVTFVPLVGIEIGVTSMVGRYVGAKKLHVAERATYTAVRLGWFFSAFVVLMFVFIPHVLVDVFKPQQTDLIFEQAKPLAIRMLQLASLYVLAEAILVSFVGALRGAGDTVWTMWVSMLIHWTFVPTAYLSLFVFNLGPIIAWTILVFMFLLFCIVFYFRFKTGKWKTIQVIQHGE